MIGNTTNPDEATTLSAQGPFGFIEAVYRTLRRFGRPYYYGAAVPAWMRSPSDGKGAFEGDWQQLYADAAPEHAAVPHCIIHSYRMYPASRQAAPTHDGATGARRQKTASASFYTDHVVPESEGRLYGKNPRPLWPSMDAVPDFIRPLVDANTVCRVMPWEYDVYVDFTLVAKNMWLLEQMHRDVLLALRLFHDRSETGESNLTGWFYASVSGTGEHWSREALDPTLPARTVTWRLKQTEAYAFPADTLESVNLEIHES